MKIVILGNTNLGYSWFVLTVRDGMLQNGHDVIEIDYKTTPLGSIKNILISQKADYVFTHLTFHQQINPAESILQLYEDVNKSVGTKFIHTLNDARHEPRYSGNISNAIYAAFVGQTHNLNKFKGYWGVPTFFWPYSSLTYDKMAEPAPDLMFNEAVFTGSVGAHQDRQQFINKLMKIMPVKIFQTQSSNDIRHRTPELSVSAKSILGLCTMHRGLKHYIDVRMFQYGGAGAVLIARKFDGIDDIIPDDLYYSFDSYDNPEYVKELWERSCFEDTWPMRENIFNFMQTHHSAKVRMKETIDVLEGKIKKLNVFL